MSRHAIISKDGFVVNVVEWRSPQDEWLPPRGHYVIEVGDDNVGIDDSYDFNTKKFDISHRLAKPDNQV